MIALPRVAPARGPLATAGQIGATVQAEMTMQWRRWGLWIAFGCVFLLLLLITVPTAVYLAHPPAGSLYARQHYLPVALENLLTFSTTEYAAIFLGLVAALLVIDRLERDQRLGIVAVQRATPQGTAGYLLGKFLGNYLAILLPALLCYLLTALVALPLGWSVTLLAKFVQAFVLVFVPSSLAAVSLVLLLASILPLRVVQIGFALLWIEFSIGPGWHTLVFTIFNPSGLYVYPVFFPMPSLLAVDPNFHTSLSLALLNIAVLLLTALVALMLAGGILALRRRNQEGA